MNTSINASSKCYALYTSEGQAIGFMAVISYPNAKLRHLRKIHRLVILPEYQGIGLSKKFMKIICELYKSKGCDIGITTSNKKLAYSLKRNKEYRCCHAGRSAKNIGIKKGLNKTLRDVNTYSFIYK